MTETEIAGFRQRLLDLMNRLGQDRSQLKDEALQSAGGEASGGISNWPLHMADLGTHQFEEDLTLTLLESKEQVLAEINRALARMDNGTFGQCEECGKKIPRERLEALPYTGLCLACAQQQEQEVEGGGGRVD